MDYRFTSEDLLTTLSVWDTLIGGRDQIHLIACGGTALTLLGYKPSTKDVDFLVPVREEYERLIRFLRDAGYQQVGAYQWRREDEMMEFDLFPGNKVYMTELVSSPLNEGRHKRLQEWKHIYLGVLNSIDLMITKMARGADVDLQDCLTLLERERIDLEVLKDRYEEAAQYDNNPEKVLKHFEVLIRAFQKKSGKKGSEKHG